MKLNKDVCKTCTNSTKHNGTGTIVLWTEVDDKNWGNNWLVCPMHEGDDYWIRTDKIPDYCKCKLEHLVINET